VDNSNARRFGYRPQGKAEQFLHQAMAAQAKLPPDPIGDRYQGGPFCKGASGFGTPVAVTAAVLMGLGFSPQLS
jgi:L-lactate permease